MANTEGTVACMNIAEDFGFIAIRTSPTTLEAFILWFGDDRSPGPMAIWIPQLSIAMVRGLTVSVTHGSTSAFIDALTVNAP